METETGTPPLYAPFYHSPQYRLFQIDQQNFGCNAKDAVLRAVAQSIKDSVHASDILFRYGGEVLVIILSNTAKDDAANRAERVGPIIETSRCRVNGLVLRVTLRLGAATRIPGETRLNCIASIGRCTARSAMGVIEP